MDQLIHKIIYAVVKKAFVCTSILILYSKMYSFIYGYFKFSELEDLKRHDLFVSLSSYDFAILAFHFKLKLNKIVHLFRLENTKKRLEVVFFSLLVFVILSMVIPSLLFFLWFVIKGEPIRIFYIEYTMLLCD